MEIFILYINFFFPIFTKWTNSSTGSIFLNTLLIIFSLFCILIRKKYLKFNQSITYINIFYFFIMTVGIISNLSIVIIRDFYEYQRPILYILGFLVGNIYAKRNKISKIFKNLERIFNIFIILNIIKIVDYKNIIFSFYQRTRLMNQTRISGTFISPYDYAYFLIFPMFLFLDRYIKTRKKKFLLKFILIFISIVLTESRSQFLTMIFSFLIYFIIKIKFSFSLREKRFIKINIGYFIFLLIYIFINFKEKIIKKLNYLYLGLYSIFTKGITADPSSNIRYQQVLTAINEFKIFGNGPSKIRNLFFENQYALYLFRYGILGIIYNIILLSCLFFICYILLKKIKKYENLSQSLIVAFSIFIFSLPIALLSNNIIDQVRISFFFYFIIGIFNNLENKNYMREEVYR